MGSKSETNYVDELGGDSNPGCLATSTKLGEQFSCLYIKNIKNIFSKHPRGGGADSADQSLPRPHTLASNLVRWVEARAKLDALYAVFLRRGPLSFILFR